MRFKRTEAVLRWLGKIAAIAVGSLIFAVGVALFLDPLEIAPGGLSGVAIILSKFLPVETGAIYLLLNVPMLLLGLKKFGREFLFSTVFATALISLLIDAVAFLCQNLPLITTQPLLASMVGSGCTALGAGIVFRCGCTTGGIDILVKVLRGKYPHIKSGVFTMALDALVVAASAIVFRDLERSLIAAMGIIVYGIVLNQVLYRTDEATMMLVVSKRNKAIARRILSELDIGATFLPATGAYTGREQEILLCVAHKRLYAKVRQIVRDEDKDAFTIITNASEVYGEGFKNPFAIEV